MSCVGNSNEGSSSGSSYGGSDGRSGDTATAVIGHSLPIAAGDCSSCSGLKHKVHCIRVEPVEISIRQNRTGLGRYNGLVFSIFWSLIE